MAIKLEINMTNKWLYSLIALGILLALGIGVCAYQSDMRAGDPLVMGHSAGEINVENSLGQVVSLQDALDELSHSYIADKQLYFGGMWGQPSSDYNNPLTGSKSCPSGYIDKTILGTYGVDYEVHLCVGIPGEVNKVAEFGGMWGQPSSDCNNPLTGSKSCPSGYIDKTILGTYGVDYELHFCYTTNLDNPVIDYFGGAFGGPSYANPATLVCSCPLGYIDKTILGTYDVDWDLHFCYK